LAEKISLDVFQKELAKRVCEEYDQVNIRSLTQDEIAAIKKLRNKKFSTYEWIYGVSPQFNYSKSLRFKDCGTINLSINLSKSKIIENCKITGDFFGSGDVSELEHVLTALACTRESILDAIRAVDLAYYFGKLSVADFLLLFDV
jgi:lipoate-protein ligase A